MGDGKITMSRGSDPYSRPGGRTLDPGLGRYSDTGILSKGVSLDEDDEADGDDELDNKEVIYFPTDDDGSESSETIARWALLIFWGWENVWYFADYIFRSNFLTEIFVVWF